MKLETTFDKGDIVFFMRDNKIRSGLIDSFRIDCSYKGNAGNWGSKAYPIEEIYLVREGIPNDGVYDRTISGNNLFKSKQELIDSIS